MIFVLFFSGEVTSYTDTNNCIPIMLEDEWITADNYGQPKMEFIHV